MEVEISYPKLLVIIQWADTTASALPELAMWTTNTLPISVSFGISNSSQCLSKTTQGHTGRKHIEFLMGKEDAVSAAWSVQLTHTSQVFHYSTVPLQNTLQRQPFVFHYAPEQSVALASFICKQVLGGKFTLQALKTQCLGWQHFSGNKSNPQFVFFLSELVHDCCPAHTTSKLNYSNISNVILYKSSMLWRAYGSRKSFSRNVTELYFQPSCSMW